MPTHEESAAFWADWKKLTPAQRRAFQRALRIFIEDLRKGDGFRSGLRVKKMQGEQGIWEMAWAPDGRATFEYRPEVASGEVHIRWRRIGTHDIFGSP